MYIFLRSLIYIHVDIVIRPNIYLYVILTHHLITRPYNIMILNDYHLIMIDWIIMIDD